MREDYISKAIEELELLGYRPYTRSDIGDPYRYIHSTNHISFHKMSKPSGIYRFTIDDRDYYIYDTKRHTVAIPKPNSISDMIILYG